MRFVTGYLHCLCLHSMLVVTEHGLGDSAGAEACVVHNAVHRDLQNVAADKSSAMVTGCKQTLAAVNG